MNINNVLILDLETSIKNRGEDAIGKNKASPFDRNNNIVAAGWKWHNQNIITRYKGMTNEMFGGMGGPLECLVGHNIKFDLLYLLQRDFPHVREWFNEPHTIWDTQLAEYLLSGQTALYPTLDYCAEKRGGTLKDDRIKEYWNEGVDTEDIPKEQLLEYLKHDVKNTEIVFHSQLLEAQQRGMLPLIYSQMKALKATIEMENNGLTFNRQGAYEEAQKLARIQDNNITVAKTFMAIHMPGMTFDDINPLSNDQVSAVLFGGGYKLKTDKAVIDDLGEAIVYKTGKRKGEVKTKKALVEMETMGMQADTKYTTPASKAGYYSVDVGVLKKLKGQYAGTISTFCKKLLEIRQLSKDINTYYIGYGKLVWPDGRIHGKLNHCSTATGRLASSEPNLQNVSGGD